MSHKEKTWDEEMIKAAAEGLRLMHTLKQGVAPGPAKPVVSDLLFDLAKLQIDTMKRLAEISAAQTERLVGTLNARRAMARGGPLVRVLVSPEIVLGSSVSADFVIRNEASCARRYPLPNVVELDPIDASDEERLKGAFVSIDFTDEKGPLAAPPECPLPFRVDIPPLQAKKLTINIPWNPRLKSGRYRGVVPLEAEGAPSAELIIELRVKGAASPTKPARSTS
jgi:hypothetical protein